MPKISAAKEMKAKVIALETYTGKTQYTDVYKSFGDSLLGVVINKVPQSQARNFKEKASARLGEAGLKLLGIVPESRALLSISVAELAEKIGGKIINNEEKGAELVENFMLGAMVVGSGVDYFGRKSNKAAIVRQDRPDMQLAALDTPTRCLVLSGNSQPPVYNVMQRAEKRGIPVVSTDAKTDEIIANIEEALANNRLAEDKKLPGLADLVRKNLDVKALV